MRHSKAYTGFKTLNGIVFILLGLFIIVQIVRVAGLRFEGFSGLVLGAAFIALGAYRIREFMRSRK